MIRALLASLLLLLPIGGAEAQNALAGVDLDSPMMTEAEMTREDVAALLAAATPNQPADLGKKRLNRLDLSGLDFSGANLRSARMNGANLAGSSFDGAVLSQAWLLKANLAGASLRGAELFQTQFGWADLSGADLSSSRAAADFTKANLTGASFAGADLSADMKNQSMGLMRGVLKNAKADGADFSGAQMMRSDLEFASLRGAKFDGADLAMATLGAADMTGASVANANFTNADVTSTRLIDLEGADSANLEAAQNLGRAFRK